MCLRARAARPGGSSSFSVRRGGLDGRLARRRRLLEAEVSYAKIVRDAGEAMGPSATRGGSGTPATRAARPRASPTSSSASSPVTSKGRSVGRYFGRRYFCLLTGDLRASPALFAPEKAFYALVRQQIQRLRDPGWSASTWSVASSRTAPLMWRSRPSRTRTTW